MPRPFIAYYRVSTAKQGRSGLGLDAQREAVESHLRGLGDGARLLAEYQEVETGKRDDRIALRQALDHCRLTGATLIIAKLDRLSRDAAFLLTLQKGDVPFLAADMPEMNNLTVGIMAVVAQNEREAISRRTKEALAAAKARGVRLGNPNGARALREGLARAGGPNPQRAAEVAHTVAVERAERLRHVVEGLKARGVHSVRAIAEALNAGGYQTPRGGRWHTTSVHRLLATLNKARA
ncbi:recombinase family protein [Inquilinus sp. Marseille-Q2685]|uniref:recombinase family protein n=1 Tax=Inquilinus sp. Marseille-Q2685 TaxID=2866581 RepID=UPI001CE45641|nr:recombinase family protein [Inquilinus sp. Marseille-Q2685]